MQGYEEGYQTEEADPQHMHQPETTEPPPVEEPECGMEDPFALPPEHRELDRERIDDRFIDRERYERFAEIVSILENMKGRPLYKNNDVTVLTLIWDGNDLYYLQTLTHFFFFTQIHLLLMVLN